MFPTGVKQQLERFIKSQGLDVDKGTLVLALKGIIDDVNQKTYYDPASDFATLSLDWTNAVDNGRKILAGQRLYSYYENNGRESSAATVAVETADLAVYCGMWSMALDCYYNAQRMSKISGSKRGQYKACLGIASVHASQGNWSLAADAMDEALKVSVKDKEDMVKLVISLCRSKDLGMVTYVDGPSEDSKYGAVLISKYEPAWDEVRDTVPEWAQGLGDQYILS